MSAHARYSGSRVGQHLLDFDEPAAGQGWPAGGRGRVGLDAGPKRPGIRGQPGDEPARRDPGPVLRAEDHAAAGGDDGVGSSTEVREDRGFLVAEPGFALIGEDLADGLPVTLFQNGIGVQKRPPQSLGEGPADGRFPRSAIANQKDACGHVSVQVGFSMMDVWLFHRRRHCSEADLAGQPKECLAAFGTWRGFLQQQPFALQRPPAGQKAGPAARTPRTKTRSIHEAAVRAASDRR